LTAIAGLFTVNGNGGWIGDRHGAADHADDWPPAAVGRQAMADIYVQVGPMDVSKAPKQYADKAKGAMQKATEKAVKAASGFTIDKKGEGYNLLFKIAECKIDPKGVSVRLSGELVRYPKREMVSTSMTGGAKGDGSKAEDLIMQCIGDIIEDLAPKALTVMKKQARP
jgi:hypothetical protein